MRKKTELELQTSTWYKKLKDEGFEDIERDPDTLKCYDSSHFLETKTKRRRDRVEPYYKLADLFLSEHKFDTEIERVIWEYHSNGLSVRKITDTLKRVKVKTNYTTVWIIVNRLKHHMFKNYTTVDPNDSDRLNGYRRKFLKVPKIDA